MDEDFKQINSVTLAGIYTNTSNAIHFSSDGKNLITFNWKEGKIEVNGDWDEAAKEFIELLRKEFTKGNWGPNGRLAEKREKLLGLLLLTDSAVSDVEMGDLQLKQHQAFLNAFPDERELLEIRDQK